MYPENLGQMQLPVFRVVVLKYQFIQIFTVVWLLS